MTKYYLKMDNIMKNMFVVALNDELQAQSEQDECLEETKALLKKVSEYDLAQKRLQITAGEQRQKEQRKKEIRQMQFDYPQLINKFSLYIGAGMTVRRAWIQIVKEYDKEKHYLGERTVYEEMRYTMNELKNGRPESECNEAFGRRCESPVYRKFGMLLSQNLRKGTKGLTNLLQREAQEAFEERKNMAKKLGEEAGTKLMIPLFLMLAVVFVIVTVPAFLTIQI